MTRHEALSILRLNEARLKQLGVRHLYLFGSTACDQAGQASDVDLFFDYEIGRFGVFELMDVKEFAASVLATKTDIMTRDSLHKTLRPQVEAGAIQVF